MCVCVGVCVCVILQTACTINNLYPVIKLSLRNPPNIYCLPICNATKQIL